MMPLIQGVKVGMMGPLAGIGDPVFWFTVRPIGWCDSQASLATGVINYRSTLLLHRVERYPYRFLVVHSRIWL